MITRTIQIDRDKIEIIRGEVEFVNNEARTIIANALANGSLVRENGIKRFVINDMVIDTTKDGSEQYTWNRNGDRVLHDKTSHTIKNGVHTTKVVGQTFRKFE